MFNKTRILIGDALAQLKTLPDQSVQCVVTSPPYWAVRNYHGDPGMIGLEPTWEDHVQNLLAVFRECRRVLRDDGTLWLNYGDAYAYSQSGGSSPDGERKGRKDTAYAHGIVQRADGISLKPKNLMMMPARFAIAMQDDGWYLRSEIIWHKPNPTPEAAKDRPCNAHEKLFLFTKNPKYFYDQVAVRTKVQKSTVDAYGVNPDACYKPPTRIKGDRRSGGDNRYENKRKHGEVLATANLRNVWKIPIYSYSGAHFATYPPKLVEKCIKAGTSEHGACGACGAPYRRIVERSGGSIGKGWHNHDDDYGVGQKCVPLGDYKIESKGWQPGCDCGAGVVPCQVLDPFGGSGTTALVANKLQRDAVIIEISPEYADLADKRISDEGGFLVDVSVE